MLHSRACLQPWAASEAKIPGDGASGCRLGLALARAGLLHICDTAIIARRIHQAPLVPILLLDPLPHGYVRVVGALVRHPLELRSLRRHLGSVLLRLVRVAAGAGHLYLGHLLAPFIQARRLALCVVGHHTNLLLQRPPRRGLEGAAEVLHLLGRGCSGVGLLGLAALADAEPDQVHPRLHGGRSLPPRVATGLASLGSVDVRLDDLLITHLLTPLAELEALLQPALPP